MNCPICFAGCDAARYLSGHTLTACRGVVLGWCSVEEGQEGIHLCDHHGEVLWKKKCPGVGWKGPIKNGTNFEQFLNGRRYLTIDVPYRLPTVSAKHIEILCSPSVRKCDFAVTLGTSNSRQFLSGKSQHAVSLARWVSFGIMLKLQQGFEVPEEWVRALENMTSIQTNFQVTEILLKHYARGDTVEYIES